MSLPPTEGQPKKLLLPLPLLFGCELENSTDMAKSQTLNSCQDKVWS